MSRQYRVWWVFVPIKLYFLTEFKCRTETWPLLQLNILCCAWLSWVGPTVHLKPEHLPQLSNMTQRSQKKERILSMFSKTLLFLLSWYSRMSSLFFPFCLRAASLFFSYFFFSSFIFVFRFYFNMYKCEPGVHTRAMPLLARRGVRSQKLDLEIAMSLQV